MYHTIDCGISVSLKMAEVVSTYEYIGISWPSPGSAWIGVTENLHKGLEILRQRYSVVLYPKFARS